MFRELKRLFQLTIQTFCLFGLKFLLKEVVRYIRFGPIPTAGTNDYQLFLQKNTITLSKSEVAKIIEGFHYTPLISIVVPVYNVAPKYLSECINSVVDQYYPNWELCLYDDASTNIETIKCLNEWTNKDERIKIKFGEVNKHIATASNEAIAMSSGEYIALLDNDDTLTPDALLEIVKVINQNPKVDFIYSDEDKIDENGEFCDPYFKPDYNPDLLLSNNYICHLSVIKKTLGDSVSWFRDGFDGAQDYDLFLRLVEKSKFIYHIPKVLYHWRKVDGSTSKELNSKSYALENGKKALESYIERNNINGSVEHGIAEGSYRVKRDIFQKEEVAIIIPFCDKVDLLRNCVESVIEKTTYSNYSIYLINNNSKEDATFQFLDEIKEFPNITVFEYNFPFNYSEINNWAVSKIDSPYVLFLNNDIEVIAEEWLSSMVEHIQRDDVGAVGAKLLYPDNTIQHAGVIVGIGGVAGHGHKNFSDKNHGYFYRANVISNFSACTGACMLTKKKLFDELGGFDEDNLGVAFNDIDYCLKLRAAGELVVYTPYAKLYHYESKSRGAENTKAKQRRFEKEVLFMIDKWHLDKYNDPFYNLNLTLIYENFGMK